LRLIYTIPIIFVLQYVFGGLVALLVSGYIFTKHSSEKKTWALKGFFVFSLLTVLWEFATFFQRTAPTGDISFFSFKLF